MTKPCSFGGMVSSRISGASGLPGFRGFRGRLMAMTGVADHEFAWPSAADSH